MSEPLIWLTLNGDLRNNGLQNYTITNDNVTFVTGGKTGKAASFNGTSARLSITGFDLDNIWSWSVWVKDDATSTDWRGVFVLNSSGGDADLQTACYVKASTSKMQFSCNGTYTSGVTYTPGQWNHFACAYDGSNYRCYINGALVHTGTNTVTDFKRTNLTIGARGSSTQGGHYGAAALFNGLICDFRIYSGVALSDYEIKLLSQGLVLHYPLDRNGLGGENLLSKASSSSANRDFGSSSELTEVTFAGWDTYCNTHLTDHGWNNLIGKPIIYRVWIDNPQDGQATSGMLHFRYSAGGTSYKQIRGTIIQPGESGWSITSTTVPTPPDGQTISYVEASLRHSSGTTPSATVNYQYAKVEMGDTPSPWSPSDADLGSTDTTVYDTSGFGNNGTATNVTYDGDTARYTASSVMDGSTSIITTGAKQTITDAVTFCMWAYMDNWTQCTGSIGNCIQGGGWGFQHQTDKTSLQVGTGTSSVTWTQHVKKYSELSSGWHHFAMTYDGFTLVSYIDGAVNNTTEIYTTKTPIFYSTTAGANSLFIGGESGDSLTTPANKFTGKVSDARVYATALSAEDIKDLFDASAKIHRDGTMYAYSYVEV